MMRLLKNFTKFIYLVFFCSAIFSRDDNTFFKNYVHNTTPYNQNRTEYSINNFDNYIEEYWQFEGSQNNDPSFGYINHNTVTDPVYEGEGALQLEYSVHNIESWGGYVKYFHMHPDIENGGVYDWSGYNTLSISYFIQDSPSNPDEFQFRLNLSDYSDIQDPEYNGLGEFFYSFHTILGNEPGWHTLDIPLIRNDSWDGTGFNLTGWAGDNANGELETHAIGGFHFEFSIAGSGQGNYDGGTIIFDDFGLKNVYDDIPPDPPGNLTIVDGNYYNLIMWDDVPNEEGETYRVYASLDPNDLSGENSEVVAVVQENNQNAYHILHVPLMDEFVSYYYSVECMDSWGNVSNLAFTESSFTNEARGIPVVSTTDLPLNPEPDGDLGEWESSIITPFFIGVSNNSWGTPNIPVGIVNNDEDLSCELYIAMDESNLYISAHIQDDNYNGHNGEWDWWEYDAIEIFIGLYNRPSEPHLNFERGYEPDYQFVFLPGSMFEAQTGLEYGIESEHYSFVVDGSSYIIEAVLPLDQIAGDSDVVYQINEGDRIPMEVNIHDNDGNGREGMLTSSHLNMDNAWQSPSVWTTTFVYPAEIMVPLSINTSEEYVLHGDTVVVDVGIDNLSAPLSSVSLSFSGFQDRLMVTRIILDNESLMGSSDWSMEYNVLDGVLETAAAGSEEINQSGHLFSIEFFVYDTVSSQLVDVNVIEYLGNENLSEFESFSGGVQVLWEPSASFESDVSSGMYPLMVNFSNISTPGTYPIVDFQWDFGNGESAQGESVSTTYHMPGDYTVSLSVLDEFGLTDTLVIEQFISVDTLYGDVDYNTEVNLFDAIYVLEGSVGLVEFDPLTQSVGDVSISNTISNLDASLIMQYASGLIGSLPIDNSLDYVASGNIELMDQNADPGTVIYVPVEIDGGNNIFGFTGTVNYDADILSIDTLLFTNETNDYIVSSNMIEPGVMILSVASINVVSDSDTLFTIGLSVGENFTQETNISITEFFWNENEPINLATQMTIGFGLSIDDEMMPNKYSLYQNYPNPFNPITYIAYDLPERANVSIQIFDMMGRHIQTIINIEESAGKKLVKWNGTNQTGESVSAGVYLYELDAGNFRDIRKMILLK